MKRLIAIGLFLLCLVSLADAQTYIRQGGPTTDWTCGVDNIAATLTECKAAPGTGKTLYVVTVVAQSTTSTAGQFILRSGTGTNCGTGTASLFPSTASVVRIAAPANTAAATVIRFDPPLVVPVNSAVCLLGVATNTVTAQITGYVTGF